MNIIEAEFLVDELIAEGKSIDQLIHVLEQKKCYHIIVTAVLLKKKLWSEEDIIAKVHSHEYYSKHTDIINPFTEEFIKMVREEDGKSGQT